MPSYSNQEIESRGPTVDAAIAAGLLRLGLNRDQVTVIVIDEGSRGLLGIGSREAIVRLAPAVVAPAPPAPPVAPPAPRPQTVAPPPAPRPQTVTPPPTPRPATPPPPMAREIETEPGEEVSDDTLAAERDTAVAVISELLEKMRVPAHVTGFQTEPDDLTGQRVNMIEIGGEDLGLLIGPRGETLDSLQFLSRLMVAHKLHRRAHFVVDVEGFRRRREQALTRLAERMPKRRANGANPSAWSRCRPTSGASST